MRLTKPWHKIPTAKQRISRYRWDVLNTHWWRPVITRQRLATGSYEGWHLLWGPIHAWDVVTHNRKRERGLTWR